MTDKTLRAAGAALVLASIAVVALAQIDRRGEPDRIALADPDPVASSAAGDPAPPEAKDEGFVYRLGVLAPVSTDNFWQFYGEEPSVWNAYVLGPTKPALFAADPEDGSLRSELATAEVAPTWDSEGWRVRVALRDDMEWSDGEPITAQDFAFTFETVRTLALGGSWADAYPPIIESVHADGPYGLRIEFTGRPGIAAWPHAIGLAPVMPAHVWSGAVADAKTSTDLYGEAGTSDVGGGPLAIVEIGDELVASVANPGYPFPGREAPDRVEYHVFAEEAGAVNALADSEIDAILSPKGLPEQQLDDLAGDPGIGVAHSPANAVRYLGFNLGRAPMSDKAFRTALALLIDREQLAARVAPDASAAYAFVSPANQAWYDPARADSLADRFRGELATRLQTAVETLRGSGWSWTAEPTIGPAGEVVPGTGLTIAGVAPSPLTILTSGDAYDPARPLYADEIAGALGWLGLEARPVETDFDTVVDLAFAPGEDGALHYDMYLLGWTLGNPTLPGYYRALFAPDGELNNTGYASAAFGEILGAYESAHNREEALEALWEMESILAADLPYLLLYTGQITEVYRTDRVAYGLEAGLGGLQGRLGAIGDVRQVP